MVPPAVELFLRGLPVVGILAPQRPPLLGIPEEEIIPGAVVVRVARPSIVGEGDAVPHAVAGDVPGPVLDGTEAQVEVPVSDLF